MPGSGLRPPDRVRPRQPLFRLLPLLALVAGAAPLAAQNGRLQIPPVRSEPAPAPAPAGADAHGGVAEEGAGAEAPPEVPELWRDADAPADRVFLEFELSRDVADSARAAALERLRALGLDTRDAALRALRSDWGPTVRLAADLLGWVGRPSAEDPRDAEALVAAASRTGDVAAAAACLDAAGLLNGGPLPSLAVTLLGHPRRQVRTVAESRLAAEPAPAHVPRLLQLVRGGRDPDVRLRAVRLLADHAEAGGVREALRRALSDASSEVAFRAAEILATRSGPEGLAWLSRELGTPDLHGPEAGYLVFALLDQQRRRGEVVIADDLLPRLTRLLDDPDLFTSGVAAAAIADVVHRDPRLPLAPVWEDKVPLALVRAVSGAIFYPQYARFAPLGEAVLREVTGLDLPDRAAWVAWLEDGGFRGVLLRAQVDLDAAPPEAWRVRWTRFAADESGAAESRVLAGPRAWWGPGDRMAGKRSLERLAEVLRESGVAGDTWALEDASAPVGELDLLVGDARKRVRFGGADGAAVAAEVFDALDALWEGLGWQVLAPAGAEEARLFLTSHLDALDSDDAGDRAGAVVALARGRLGELSDEVLRDWCEELLQNPAVPTVWTREVALEYLAEVPRRAADGSLASLVLGAALMAPDFLTADDLAAALSSLEEPLRGQLLRSGLTRLGRDAVARAAVHGELPVRVAALRALAYFGADAGADLVAALDADSVAERVAALRSLGEVGASGAAPRVAALTAVGHPREVRLEAVRTLAALGAEEAADALFAAARDEDPALRAAALEALASTPGEAAVHHLGELFEDYAATPLETSYFRALVGRGPAAARRLLRARLADPDVLLARRAAAMDGWLGDPAAVPVLLRWLPLDPRNPQLLEALAAATCVDFRDLPDPAGVWLAWWRDHSDQAPARWFAEAAEQARFRLPPGFHDPSLVDPAVSVPVLLDVAARGPGSLRPAATYWLEQVTGVDGGVVLPNTPAAEAERRLAPWREWLRAR